MNLPNTFVSSSFFMRTNDVLHVILKDETGTAPVIYLTSEDNPSVPEAGTPLPPVIGEATDILSTSFSANWSASTGATKYYLDVATDNTFTSFVSGFENKDVGDVVTYSVTGLSVATTYYYRVRAYNTIGTGKSSSFASATTHETITDEDGNTYEYVTIGTQQWFINNLRTTTYADSTPIPSLALDADWIAEDGSLGHDGAYCAYNNDPLNITDHGLLYNQYAITNAHGLAPTGWRIPTNDDWNTLLAYIGGSEDAGGKLKETGTTQWTTPNTGATDEYGFSAYGSGWRSNSTGEFDGIGSVLFLYEQELGAWSMSYDSSEMTYVPIFGVNGYSVRCVRDIV